MLDIFKNIPGLRREEQEAQQEEAEKKVNPFPTGPVTYKVPTNGQRRRAVARKEKAAHRKHIKRLGRQHWALRQEVAVLQARLVVVGELPNGHGQMEPGTGERADKVRATLIEQYGSVEQARQRLNDIFGVEG